MASRLLAIEDTQGLLIIRDRLSLSAAFLIPHLLQLALSAELKVVLLLVQDSLPHYQQALRKLGVNLANCISTNQVAAVDIASSFSGEGGLQSAVQQVAQACQESHASNARGVCILIDSLTALHGLSNGQQEWHAFLHYCQALRTSTKGQYICAMIAHEDVENDSHWIRWLWHAAKVEVEVRSLESGASQDVTGQVLMTKRQASAAFSAEHNAQSGDGALDEPRRLFFKLGAGDIRFFH